MSSTKGQVGRCTCGAQGECWACMFFAAPWCSQCGGSGYYQADFWKWPCQSCGGTGKGFRRPSPAEIAVAEDRAYKRGQKEAHGRGFRAGWAAALERLEKCTCGLGLKSSANFHPPTCGAHSCREPGCDCAKRRGGKEA